jgi:oligopeptide transport system substrate-binding protein
LNFRESIFHALDRKAAIISKEPYEPEAKMLNTITPKNFVDYQGTDYTQMEGLADITGKNSFDENLAKQYKEKAMKELQGKVKFPVKVYLPYNTGASDSASREQVVEQQLEKALGSDYIDVVIDPKPATGYLKDVRKAGNYAMLLCNWGPDYADPETYSDPFNVGGTYNKPELAEGDVGTKYEELLNKAKEEVTDINKRYQLFADAESYLINQAIVIPYSVGGDPYVAPKLNPFDAQFSPFGVISEKYKGQTLLDKSLSNDEFKEKLAKWEQERTEALKKAGTK